jgi:hypothetical protein
MNYRYLIFSGFNVWGKKELTKDYFVNAVQRGDFIVDLEAGKYFDKDNNQWKILEGDE